LKAGRSVADGFFLSDGRTAVAIVLIVRVGLNSGANYQLHIRRCAHSW
jgi:hypothetical protein